jgi:iron(III) transport system substrate-binding protein
VALTNHYYVLRRLHPTAAGTEPPPEATPPTELAIHHFAAGDAGNLALVTGAGLLRTATHRGAALRFLAFLLSAPAQTHFAQTVREYPLLSGTPLPAYMTPFERARALSPTVDFGRMTDLEGTLRLLREAELL